MTIEHSKYHDETYLSLAREILSNKASVFKPNRTGIESISYFGPQMEFDLSEGFPLLTTKKMFWRGIAEELFWFLRGETNIKPLVDKNIHFWDGNAFQGYLIRLGKTKELPLYSPEWYKEREVFSQRIKEDAEFARVNGDLGPVYGSQWRRWKTTDGRKIDQIGDVIDLLKKSPSSRRIIVTAWNPEEVPNMVLPPCHSLFQLNVAGDQLDCKLYQRSADFFLGVPFNTASYALLTTMLAQEAGLKPGRFIHSFGDAHFYAGCNERGAFYRDHLEFLKSAIAESKKPEDYLSLINSIQTTAAPELSGRDGLDHITGILEQLARDPRKHPMPRLTIANKSFTDINLDDLKLEYSSEPDIRRRMAV